MNPTAVVKFAAVFGIAFLGILLFPTMQTTVQGWVTDVMPGLGMSPLEEFVVKGLPYAGFVLYIMFALWVLRKGSEE